MRTIGQVVSTARAILQDLHVPYRFPDTDLYGYVSDAVLETRRLRPDMFADRIHDPVPHYGVGDTGSALPVPDVVFPAVANYVAGRAEIRDAEFSSDSRAAALVLSLAAALLGR